MLSLVRVKICGIKSLEEARAAIDAGAHALGFVFAASRRRIEPEAAKRIIKRLPPWVSTVGVFVDEDRSRLLDVASYCGLHVLQLHGDENPLYCRSLPYPVVKALKARDRGVLELIPQYPVEAILLDSFVPGAPGGTGKTFDWEIAKEAKALGIPLILAGGLNPENVGEAILKVRPYGVDVSSGVETQGQKDPAKIVRFMEAVFKASVPAARSCCG